MLAFCDSTAEDFYVKADCAVTIEVDSLARLLARQRLASAVVCLEDAQSLAILGDNLAANLPDTCTDALCRRGATCTRC